jgi:hypothetical protein
MIAYTAKQISFGKEQHSLAHSGKYRGYFYKSFEEIFLVTYIDKRILISLCVSFFF